MMSFEGKVTRIKGCSVYFKIKNERYVIPATEIFSIQFNDTCDRVYTQYLKLLEIDPNACLKGRMDAEGLHGKKGTHFVLGFLFGPFAMLGTLISQPTPDRGKNTYLLSNNKELFTDPVYISCYKKKLKLS